ncbi:MAG: hypothetical protein ACO28M_01965 [Vulcanococcus sp.]
MASPLDAYSNGDLAFQLPAAGTVTDPTTGNVRANTAASVYRVFVKEIGATIAQNFAGVDVRTSRFEGYVTNPQLLNAAVVEGMEGTLSLDAGQTYTVTLVASRSPYGRGGIGQLLEANVGHVVVMDAVRQE